MDSLDSRSSDTRRNIRNSKDPPEISITQYLAAAAARSKKKEIGSYDYCLGYLFLGVSAPKQKAYCKNNRHRL